MRELTEKHGKVFRLPFRYPTFFLADPADIRHVLVTNHRNYSKARGLRISRSFLGTGLITADEPKHSALRKLIQPSFSGERIGEARKVMQETVERRLQEAWRDGETINVSRELARMSLAITTIALFGKDLTGEIDRIQDALLVCQRYIERRVRFGRLIPEHWPTPSTLRYRKAVGVFDRIIYQLIEERRREKDHRHDLLTALLEAKQENGEPLSGKDIRDELVTMLLAGHETTANALSWTLYLLSQYPEAEERFHEEIDRIAQPCTFDDSVMSQLPYTAALFAESMRLFPPVWRIGRRALLPDQLPGGVKLPSGAEIVILISVLHRDPALFPEPDRFNPDRFLIPGPRSSFLPFGGGPRICIGEDFARNEAVIMLALIGSGFRLSLMNTRRVKPEPLIALRPREHIMMKLHSREKSITRQTHFFSRQFQETA